MRGVALTLALRLLPPLVAGAQEFTTLKGHGGPVMDIAVDPATGRVATASFDNSVGLWEGRTPTWLEGHQAAVITVAHLRPGVLLSGGDDFALWLWDSEGGRKIGTHQGKIADIAVGPDGQSVATASWDGTIGYWQILRLGGPAQWTATRKVFSGHGSGVNSVRFSADGKRLYSASSDGTVRVWEDGGQRRRILVSNGFGVNKLVVNEAEGWLAYGAVDGATRVVDLDSGAEIADFTLERRPILSMAYHAATDQLAVGDGQGYIMIIDTARWHIVRDFRAMRQGPVWALDFSPDGQIIYAGGIEDIAYAWPVALLDEFDPVGGASGTFLRATDQMPNGERQFMRRCSICHALGPPPSRKAGPSLYGLFGRRAGTVIGYRYSEILTGSDIIWSDDTIDALFDIGPDHYIPGSKMPMQRIRAPEDRQDLVDYLRVATRAKED